MITFFMILKKESDITSDSNPKLINLMTISNFLIIITINKSSENIIKIKVNISIIQRYAIFQKFKLNPLPFSINSRLNS